MSEGPAPLQPVSASDLSGIAGTLQDSLCYEKEDCSDAGYFVGSSTSTESTSTEAFAALLSGGLESATNEKQLQDAVFSALASHPSVTIMEESKKKEADESSAKLSRHEKKKRKAAEKKHQDFVGGMKEWINNKFPVLTSVVDPILNQFVQVAEKDTKNLLDLYAKEYLEEVCEGSTKMKEAEPGLFIKTSSRPDIVALIGNGNQKDILFSEVKNDERYSNADAVEQQICYLMLLLYWWRVICNRDVESVCGFTICGPRCKSNNVRKRKFFGGEADEMNYHVSFIEVSVPSMLGQLNTARIWQRRYPVSDPTGLKDLGKFISNQERWNNVEQKDQLEPSSVAWMTLPRGFLKVKTAARSWELVAGGTAAVVVRCKGADGVQKFLHCGVVDFRLCGVAAKLWKDFLKQSGNEMTTYYVKVKTRGTERSFVQQPQALWEYANTMKESFQNFGQHTGVFDDFFATYPCPVVLPPTSKFYAILMRHRGSVRLDAQDALKDVTEAYFARKLLALWDQTVFLSQQMEVWHGDVADFNILLDDNSGQLNFVLIDWDEASEQPKARHPRDLPTEMRHHKALRTKQQLYTDVQFALLYCKIRNQRYRGKKWDVHNETSLKGFRDAIGSNADDKVVTEARAFVAEISGVIDDIDQTWLPSNSLPACLISKIAFTPKSLKDRSKIESFIPQKVVKQEERA